MADREASYEQTAENMAGSAACRFGAENGEERAAAEATVEQIVEKMAAEVAGWQEKYVRLSAEFDNYRKRTLRERVELAASAGEDVMKSLLPVLDDLERAIKAMSEQCSAKNAVQAGGIDTILEGIVLIYNKLRDTLRAKGLTEIEALGAPLDTDFHEAVAKVSTSKSGRGKIIDVIQKGYKLGDKVIRYAKVVVGE